MGILKKWILSIAEKIKEKDRIEESKAEEKRKLKDEMIRVEISKAKDILMEYLKKKIEEKEKEECHIKVGEKVILNIYGIGKKECNNGWDGGPNMLFGYLKDKSKPAIFKITKIYVDSSLASDRIEKFISDWSYRNLNVEIDKTDPTRIIKMYEKYVENKTSESSIFDRYGLYKTAHFESEDPFKPSWGLNVDSFISENSVFYSETYSIWKKDIELNGKLSSLKNKIQLLMEKKNKLIKEIESRKRIYTL